MFCFEILVLEVKPIENLQMQMIFQKHFQIISSKLTSKLMKFLFSNTLVSTYFKMENLFANKISHMDLKFHFCLSKLMQRLLTNVFIDYNY